jgi:carboxyl-terminal processing protease
MRSVLIFLLTFTIFISLTPGQNTKTTTTQIKNTDPFSLSPGKSFSASGTATKLRVPKTDKIDKRARRIISRDFQQAIDLINRFHSDGDKVDYNELVKSSITTMLHSLDPHSNYFDNNEFNELINDQNSEYFGIGATIANFETKGIYETFVTSTFPESPAFRSGLRFGDQIIEVNGKKVSGKSSLFVRNNVRGPKGTNVRLKILRPNFTKPILVNLRRNRVPQPSIPDAYILSRGVGYIDLSTGFNYSTNEELSVAILELKKRGMNSLILDLRDNPGGILEQAVRVAEQFLPEGKVIVSQKGRFVIDNRRWTSKNPTPNNFPLIVLVNEESASASEIVAGALQDYDRALIVGDKTFGKGLVQSIISLPYGTGLTLTTAKYFTPTGRSIQRDYSHGNLYDYYQHKIGLEKNRKDKKRTFNGRTVFGGDGITPDEIIKTPELTQNQIELLDDIFLFSRELISGKIRGFENYKIIRQRNYGLRVADSDYPATIDLFQQFKLFRKTANKNNRFLEKDSKFILQRIRYNVISAAFGNVAAKQVLIQNDSQVKKAINLLPRAEQLAQRSRITP